MEVFPWRLRGRGCTISCVDKNPSDTNIWSNYLLKFILIVHLDILYFNIFTSMSFLNTMLWILFGTMLPDYRLCKAGQKEETEGFTCSKTLWFLATSFLTLQRPVSWV